MKNLFFPLDDDPNLLPISPTTLIFSSMMRPTVPRSHGLSRPYHRVELYLRTPAFLRLPVIHVRSEPKSLSTPSIRRNNIASWCSDGGDESTAASS